MRLLLLPAAIVLSGCGASTVRLAGAPTIDSGGKPGFTATFSLGIGMPVDFHGRSHHFIQALGTVGGGRDGATGKPMFVAALNADYIHWAEPRMDVRAGLHASFESIPLAPDPTHRHGAGAHFGLLPMVWASDGNWLVSHVCVGPEFRAEAFTGNPAGGALGLFSLPLVVELNLLAAGD